MWLINSTMLNSIDNEFNLVHGLTCYVSTIIIFVTLTINNNITHFFKPQQHLISEFFFIFIFLEIFI